MIYVYKYNHRISVWHCLHFKYDLQFLQIFAHMIHSMYSDLRWSYGFINFNNYHTEYSIVIVMLMRYKIRLRSSDIYVVTIYSIVVTWYITASQNHMNSCILLLLHDNEHSIVFNGINCIYIPL